MHHSRTKDCSVHHLQHTPLFACVFFSAIPDTRRLVRSMTDCARGLHTRTNVSCRVRFMSCWCVSIIDIIKTITQFVQFMTHTHIQVQTHDEIINVVAADDDGKAAYEDYEPRYIRDGDKHPDPVIETASLASIAPPNITNVHTQHHLADVIAAKALSRLQLESVVYANIRFKKKINNEYTSGFFLGDGAGVGKGRQIAANILEHFRRGGKRVLWVSVSTDLRQDAERDLKDLGVPEATLIAKTKLFPKDASTLMPVGSLDAAIGDGIFFCTYSFLISGTPKRLSKKESKELERQTVIKMENKSFGASTSTATGAKTTVVTSPLLTQEQKTKQRNEEVARKIFGPKNGASRPQQIMSWLKKDDGAHALIIFDECHKAKSLKSADGRPTKTAEIVRELQQQLPAAKVLYASATGASEPGDLAYMERLGSFKFDCMRDLVDAIESCKYSGSEIASMGLKANGAYLCRTLSFKGAEFDVHKCTFAPAFKKMFDMSTEFWQLLLKVWTACHAYIGSEKRSQTCFWSAHQRFFRLMLMAGKIDETVRLAKDAVTAKNMCVVIGLQSTGESSLKHAVDSGLTDEDLDAFISAPKMVVAQLIDKHFPTETDNIAAVAHMETWNALIRRMEICVAAWQRGEVYGDDVAASIDGGAGGGWRSRSNPGTRQNGNANNAAATGGGDDNDDDDDIQVLAEKNLDQVEEEKVELAKRTGLYIDLDVAAPAAPDVIPIVAVDRKRKRLSPPDTSQQTTLVFEEVRNAKNKSVVDAKPERRPLTVRLRRSAVNYGAGVYVDDDDVIVIDSGPPSPVEAAPAPEPEPVTRHEDTSPQAGAAGVAEATAEAAEAAGAAGDGGETPPCVQQPTFVRAAKPELICDDKDDDDFVLLHPAPNASGGGSYKDALFRLRELLLIGLEALKLPPNPLDKLIDDLGGKTAVAEMTGRSNQQVADTRGKVQSMKRKTGSAQGKMVNIDERKAFQDGSKLYAIISEASSSGVSLHADRRVPNQRRRLHITLELPWSAEKTVQQLGRSLRSNQSSAPVYKLLVSQLAGEQRFASAAAQRIRSLGAILKADRNAMGEIGLNEFDINTKHGLIALKQTMSDIQAGVNNDFGADTIRLPNVHPPAMGVGEGTFYVHMHEALRHVGIDVTESREAPKKVVMNKFLNRLLGMKTRDQHLLFEYFNANYDATLAMAKANGDSMNSIVELTARRISYAPGYPKVVYTQPDSKAQTKLVKSVHDLGVPYDEALAKLASHRGHLESSSQDPLSSLYTAGFFVSEYQVPYELGRRQPMIMLAMPIQRSAAQVYQAPTTYRILRPNNMHATDMDHAMIHLKYKRLTDQRRIETLWHWWFDKTESEYVGSVQPRCRQQFTLTGDVLSVFRDVRDSLMYGNKQLAIVRFQVFNPKEGVSERIVGVDVPRYAVDRLTRLLKEIEQSDGLCDLDAFL